MKQYFVKESIGKHLQNVTTDLDFALSCDLLFQPTSGE